MVAVRDLLGAGFSSVIESGKDLDSEVGVGASYDSEFNEAVGSSLRMCEMIVHCLENLRS